MANSSSVDKSKNKNFVINNKFLLKQFAHKSYDFWGDGVVVVNLLLLRNEILDHQDLDISTYNPTKEDPTIHQAISFIPRQNFWFKMLSLKIKKKHQIDIQSAESHTDKFLIVFIKDASIEHFSIYSLKKGNINKQY